MATLKSLPEGTIVKIPINGVVQDCYIVGINHYGKNEVTLLAPGYKIFGGLMTGTEISSGGRPNNNGVIYYPSPYIGSRYDILVENIFPSMLADNLRNSMVSVPISVFTIFPSELREYAKNTSSGGRTSVGNILTSSCYHSGGEGYGGLLSYGSSTTGIPYPIPYIGEVVNRRAFLFSVSEALGFTSKSVVRDSVVGTSNWKSGTIYFDPVNSSERPSGYKTSSFPWLVSKASDPMVENMEYRGSALVRSTFSPPSGGSDVSAELGIIAEMWNKCRGLGSSGTKICIHEKIAFLSDTAITSMREFGPYPIYFGFCLDGNCTVANGSGGVVITRGTAVESYRKIDGVWYRTI